MAIQRTEGRACTTKHMKGLKTWKEKKNSNLTADPRFRDVNANPLGNTNNLGSLGNYQIECERTRNYRHNVKTKNGGDTHGAQTRVNLSGRARGIEPSLKVGFCKEQLDCLRGGYVI